MHHKRVAPKRLCIIPGAKTVVVIPPFTFADVGPASGCTVMNRIHFVFTYHSQSLTRSIRIWWMLHSQERRFGDSCLAKGQVLKFSTFSPDILMWMECFSPKLSRWALLYLQVPGHLWKHWSDIFFWRRCKGRCKQYLLQCLSGLDSGQTRWILLITTTIQNFSIYQFSREYSCKRSQFLANNAGNPHLPYDPAPVGCRVRKNRFAFSCSNASYLCVQP